MISDKERRVIAKYLAEYAESEARAVTGFDMTVKFESVLILPCYDEPIDKVKRLLFHHTPGSVLFIVVVNAPTDAAALPLHTTKQLYAVLSSFPLIESKSLTPANHECQTNELDENDLFQPGTVTLHQIPDSNNALLLVDRVIGARIPPKQGVGLARKIGADLALQLFYQGLLSNGWVGSTDADAKLPSEYFNVLQKLSIGNQPYSGTVFGFSHVCTLDKLRQASLLYDLSLRYYVDALAWSGSPYAFATIGSCLAFNLVAYAQVRGFPKRAGGEDFYLLNKLCKLKLTATPTSKHVGKVAKGCVVRSGIQTITHTIIELEARESHRVPFGTGPAITKILNETDPVNSYRFYHPRIFVLLRIWIDAMHSMWQAISIAINKPLDAIWLQCLKATVVNNAHILSTQGRLMVLTAEEQSILKAWCDESGWLVALKHCYRQASNAAAFLVQLHTWFDGFRTLKFVHYIRQNLYQSLAANPLLAEAARLPDSFEREVLAEFEKRLYDSSGLVTD